MSRVVLSGALCVGAGCQQSADKSNTSANAAMVEQNAKRARELTLRGMSSTKLPEAISLFRQAIKADPYNGAAHNNLGAALLNNGELYEAAKEFQEAIRLLPADPNPRMNLGMDYESAEQLRTARDQYEQALVVAPDYLPALQALTRVRVRMGEMDRRTIELLRIVASRSTETEWRDWAMLLLAKAGVQDLPTTQITAPPASATETLR